MRVAELAGRPTTASMQECLDALDSSAPADYRELAVLLVCDWLERAVPPRRVGLGGGQGAGKSTLARLLEEACAQVGLRACVLSLDDFYLTQAARMELAARVHPLFATRGPPGTHDTALCRATLSALADRDAGEVEIPVFDKGIDDRIGSRTFRLPADIVLLEGWCVGARPVAEAQLLRPLNDLERELDREGVWRRAVNERLASDYCAVWDDLEELIFLRVPGLEAVRRWRLAQEQTRPEALRMNREAVDRFVQYFERITLSMLRDLPARANQVIELDQDHRIARLGTSRRR